MIPLGRSSEISWSLQLHLLCIVIYFSAEASDELPVHKRGCKKHREEPAELMQSLVSRSSPNSSRQAHEQSCLGRRVLLRQPWGFWGSYHSANCIMLPASSKELSFPPTLQTLNDSKVTKASSHMTNSNYHQTLGPVGPNSSLPLAIPTSVLEGW